MESYLFPIQTAFITFPIIGFVLLIPFLILQYRKHGYINYFRMFILYSLLLFLMAAYYLVILPFPTTFDTCSLQRPGTQHYQLVPFTSILDIVKETSINLSHPASYLKLLKERAFLQVAFNFLLLLPLGIYLRYYFRRNLLQTCMMTFCVSLFFEVTQLTGFFGLYNCPYRLFDVDDLLLNTLGGITGYIIAPIFLYFLPNIQEMDQKVDFAKQQVGIIRRLLAVWIDWLVISGISSVFFHFTVSMTFFLNPTESLDELLLTFLFIFVYFILIPYFTNGRTLGKWLLHLRLNGQGEKVTMMELFKRYGLLYYCIGSIHYILTAAIRLNENAPIVFLLLVSLSFLFNGLIVLHIALHLFKQDKRFFYEKVSRTYHVITFTNKK